MARRLGPHVVPRERISKIMDGAAVHPVVVVRAPRSSGKSVALATWLTEADADGPTTVFVAVDDETRDRARFWHAVISTLQDARVISPTHPLSLCDPAPDPEGLRVELVRGLRQLGCSLRIVVDDFQRVDDQALLDDLVAIVDSLETVSLVLATQSPTSFESTNTPGVFVALVDADVLALTLDETRAVAGAMAGHPVLESFVVALWRETYGHVGMAVAICHGQGGTGMPDESSSGQEAVFAGVIRAAARDYVRSLVSSLDTSDGLSDFLWRTSVVETLPLRLAAELTGQSWEACRRQLDRCVRDGIGTYLTLDRGSMAEFRFFDVVRTSVRDDLAARRSGLERTLVRTAALWALRHDEALMAVACAVDLVDMPLLTSIVQRFWTGLIAGDGVRLAELLARLPRRRTQRHPVVLALTALSYANTGVHSGRSTQAHEATVAAVRSRLGSVAPGERAFLLGLETQSRRILGDTAGARRAAEQAEQLIPTLEPADVDMFHPVAPYVFMQLAGTFFLTGDSERALAAFARATGEAEGPDQAVQRSESTTLSAFLLALVGDVDIARRLLEVSTDDSPVSARLVRAYMALEDFRPLDARRLVTRIDPLFGTYEYWPLVLTIRSLAAVALGRRAVAEYLPEFDASVGRFRLLSPTDGELNLLLGFARLRLLVASERIDRAAALLDLLPGDAPRVVFWRAVVALVQGDTTRALDLVLEAQSMPGLDRRTRIVVLLLRSVVDHRLQRDTLAVENFRVALDLIVASGARGVLFDVPRADIEFLARAAAALGDSRGLDLLAEFGGLHTVFPPETALEALSAREMIVLRRLASGASIPVLATELHVSVNTVKTQLKSIYRKLGAADRREAVESALRRGLIGY